MRYSLILSAGLVPLASAASNVCSTGLLPLFAPLSTWPAAVSYCSSKYPASSTTVTFTAPGTLTTTTVTSTQTLQPTPYYKKKRNLERRKAWQRFRENMIKAGLDPRAVSTTTTPPPTGTAVATVTGVAPTPVTPTPITPTTTVITKATTTATSKTTTTTAACGTGKAALFCTLVAQASTLVSQFCSCYDPAPTITATTTVTPTTTITTFTLETITAPQLIASCPTVDRLDPTDPFEIIDGTGCTSFGQNTKNPVNCGCVVRAGGNLNGPGVCSSGYYPNEPCTTDRDCPNGRHCLGYPDPSSQSYLYYCSVTQTCANGGLESR